jgi:hypothetical protein
LSGSHLKAPGSAGGYLLHHDDISVTVALSEAHSWVLVPCHANDRRHRSPLELELADVLY